MARTDQTITVTLHLRWWLWPTVWALQPIVPLLSDERRERLAQWLAERACYAT